MKAIAKTWVALVAVVLAALVPVLDVGGPQGLTGWINVVILVAGAVQVYNAPNVTWWPAAKTVAAGVSAGGVVLVSFVGDGVTLGEGVQVAIAVLAAVGVYRVPNAATGRHARPDDA